MQSVSHRQQRTLARSRLLGSSRVRVDSLERRELLIATYPVGQIPSDQLAGGLPLSFDVVAPSGASGPVSMTMGSRAFGSPTITSAGGVDTYTYALPVVGSTLTLQFNPSTGVFSYTPDADDQFEFDLRFSVPGRDGTGLKREQVVTVVPRTQKNEYDLVSSATTNLPDPESPDYVTTTVTNNPARSFNTVTTVVTRNVEISGKTIVLQNGNANGLADRFTANGVSGSKDIENLTVNAERVVLRGALWFPRTNVTINARDIVFDDSVGTAQIGTDAVQYSNAYPGLNGADGEAGGNITLNAANLTVPAGSSPRLITNGSRGQRAAEGHPGSPGTDMPVVAIGPNNTFPDVAQFRLTKWVYYGYPLYWQLEQVNKLEFGTDAFPTDGTPASPGGRPGAGGNGGNVQVPQAYYDLLSPLTKTYAGGAGIAASNQPGGRAGYAYMGSLTWTTAYHLASYGDPNHQGVDILDRAWKTHTSHAGADFIAVGNTDGSNGSYSSLASTATSWILPSVLKPMLAYVKDAYLAGNIEFAKSATVELQSLLDQVPPPATGADPFAEIRNDVEVMKGRAAAGLDYFGNPPGWTPMLSFVTNLAAYQTEISSALRLKYLAAMIQNSAANAQAAVTAMTSAKSQIDADIARATSDLANQQSLLPDLQTRIGDIDAETNDFEILLAQREAELMKQAVKNAQPPFWKKALGILGAVAKIVPIGQPALGLVGTGLTTISTLSSQPLAAISQIGGALGSFKDAAASLGTTQTNFGNLLTTLKPPANANSTTLKNYAKTLGDTAKQWSAAAHDFNTQLPQFSAPSDAVAAELAKLKAQDPSFNSLVDQLTALNAKKEAFARDLNNAMQTIGTLITSIDANQQSSIALSVNLSDNLGRLDRDAVEQVKDIGRRADERLLRYQYYMAKAYEYETLKPYTGSFTLQRLGDRINAVLGNGPGWIDSAANLADLQSSYELGKQVTSTLYEDGLRSIADKIVTDKNNNIGLRKSQQLPSFPLSAAELNTLNTTGAVTIHLMDRGVIPQSDDVVKISHLAITTIANAPVGDNPGVAVEKISLEHSGVSLLERGGRIFRFNHLRGDASESSNPISLGSATYDAVSGDPPIQSQPDPTEVALLAYLTGQTNPSTQPEIYYTQPGAWADVTIRKEDVTSGVPVTLTNLRLTLTITYEQAATDKVVLDVRQPIGSTLTPSVVVNGGGALPLAAALTGGSATSDANETADVSGRYTGVGNFLRTYAKNTAVTLVAQPTYGNMEFDHWVNESNATISTSPTLNLTLSANRLVRPVYVPSLLANIDATTLGFDVNDSQSIKIGFGRLMNSATVQSSDLIVTNAATGIRVNPAAFSTVAIDGGNSVAWRYNPLASGALPNGNYHVSLPAGSVAGSDGKTLAQNFDFDFTVLAGDSNSDGIVNFNDLLVLAKNYGKTGMTFSNGNFDYSADGKVDFADLLILAKAYGAKATPLLASLIPQATVPGDAASDPTLRRTRSTSSTVADIVR